MKKALTLALFLIAGYGFAQLPSVKVKDIHGNEVDVATLSNDGKPMIINFWATWCKPCVLELSTIADDYEDWVKETGVKLYAVSIDDSRNTAKVAPFVKSRAWLYDILLDANEDLKRALGVQNPPHTFVVDGSGKVVWQHMGYQLGDEKVLFDVIKKVAAGQPVEE